ncbi:endolytic transglycosylase MltG [Bernardetia litoralis]|uniref:endolytic transglycosylase MltG n=1 Tax=Bernardetia litoralis TaxID=999 RepID=UPI001FDF300F|nr:endolytic transglycosylase MltG [Bernardetia litoralis]
MSPQTTQAHIKMATSKKEKSQSKISTKYKIFLGLFAGLSIFVIATSYYIYQMAYTPSVLTQKGAEEKVLYIPKGMDYNILAKQLRLDGTIQHPVAFGVFSKWMGYVDNVKAGRYILTPKMNTIDFVRQLRSGNQSPVNVTFNENLRFLPEIAGKITNNLAIDSAEFATYLQDENTAKEFGFDKDNFISMFLPNTYEMYWTDSKEEVVERLKKEYDKFWTDERKELAKAQGLSQKEVAILASIVDAETRFADEKPRVAGVYLNRLKKEMLLQADPTLVFAHNDFTIKRVLNKHKEIESPFNTYKYVGLPPSPIRLPSIAGLNAVLKPENHEYIFFCAKEDLSGYHAFAKTNAEHEANARRYHRALNERGIK